MLKKILSVICGLIICVSMIASNPLAAQKDDIEVIIMVSNKAPSKWQNLVKNSEIKKILQKSKLYILYPLSEGMGEEKLTEMNTKINAANSILYMSRLLGKKEQFDLVDKAYMAPSQEIRARNMQDAQKRTINYMRNLPVNKQEEAILKSMDYSKKMWQLFMVGVSKLGSDGMDALLNDDTKGYLVFVNGELVPDYFEKLKRK